MKYEVDRANTATVEGYAPQGSIEALDPFSTPTPGQSLTMAPGSQKFERPWEFTDPDDCVVYIMERMETDREAKEAQLSQIASGVPIEYIVNTIAFVGFSEGMWSPDVAELIKPPLAMYFTLIAMAEDIPMVMFNPEASTSGNMTPDRIAESMSLLNPDGYESVRRGVMMENLEEEQLEDSFLGPMEETIPQEGELPTEELPTEELATELPDEGGML